MKKTFKRIVATATALTLMLLAFASCGSDKPTASGDSDKAKDTSAKTAKYEILDFNIEGCQETYIIGFRKGDQTLRDEVQKLLGEMKADGTMADISTKWFGSDVTTVKEKPETVKSDAKDDSLKKVKDAGKFILGLDATFKPMGYTNDKDQIEGFDIDLAKEVCKRMGVELELKGIDWQTKEKTLDSGMIDCIWNGLSYSKERDKAMNLSEPYLNNDMVFVDGKGSTFKSLDDLKGKKIAVQTGSTAQEILSESDLAKDITIVELGTNVECLQQLDLGMIDAAYMDKVVADYEIYQQTK